MIHPDFVIRAAQEAELEFVQGIRKIVFTDEQQIPANLDHDGLDEKSIHALILLKESNRVVASGRLYLDANSTRGIIARIAVLKEFRGFGFGKEVVRFLEQEAKSRSSTQVELHPHKHLYKFYADMGYSLAHDKEENVAGHTLLTMIKNL